MPCYDSWGNALREEAENRLGKKVLATLERNDKLSRMLCSVMRKCDADVQKYLCDGNQELAEWLAEHKEFDARDGRNWD